MEYTIWDEIRNALYDLGETIYTLVVEIPIITIKTILDKDGDKESKKEGAKE